MRQNTGIENFVNNIASHYDVSRYVQAPGVIIDALLVGMKCSAINPSRSEFEIFTFTLSFSTKHDLSESGVD